MTTEIYDEKQNLGTIYTTYNYQGKPPPYVTHGDTQIYYDYEHAQYYSVYQNLTEFGSKSLIIFSLNVMRSRGISRKANM